MTTIPTQLFSGLRGSAGDQAASRNASAQYVYPRAAPADPNTIRQQFVRSQFGAVAQLWRDSLTEADRAGWRQYAARTPVGKTLKGPKFIDGKAHFIRTAIIRRRGTIPVIETPPVACGLPPFLPFAYKVAAGDTFIGVSWDIFDTWAQEAGALAWISTTVEHSRFINSVKPPYAFRGAISSAATSPITLPLGFTATLGSHIFAKAQVQRADARLGTAQAAIVTVIPP